MKMQVFGGGDNKGWMGVLERSLQYDFHHLPHYHRVAEHRGEGVAQLFVCTDAAYMIALPLLLRPVEDTGHYDATSVYGYSGPIFSHADIPEPTVRAFQTQLNAALLERGVIAAFSRLHPLIPHEELLRGFGECRTNGQTVSIDLTESPEQQWLRYNKSCRRSIKALRAAGFVGLHDREKRYLGEFVSIYRETMRRASAQSYYDFDEDYFRLLCHELGDVLQLFVALSGNEVAAASVATTSGGIVQDFLGGTRTEYLEASPDRLVVDTERLWATAMGARVLHVGGGVGAQQDSLFRYKAGFSDRRHTFSTWRCILDAKAYNELCEMKAQRNRRDGLLASSVDYFPAYRSVSAPRREFDKV